MKLRFLLPVVLMMIAAQDEPPITITSPQAGEVLRGEVTIMGTTDIPNFFSAQLDFAYASDPTGTWFAIQTLSQPVTDSSLTTWNTTSISDGDYMLRLRVILVDNTFQEVTVPVQIGNDVAPVTPTAVATATLNEVEVQIPTPFLLAASPTPTTPPRPTPTGLPANPAALGQTAIYASLGRGAAVIIGLFILAGLIIRFRRF